MTWQYTVFNVQQANGLALPSRWGQPPHEWVTHGEAEKVIVASGPTVEHVHGDRAYYRVAEDKVVLPEHHQFPTLNGYYQTALHECAHSTGHPDRMNRETLKERISQRLWIAGIRPRRIAGPDQRHDDRGARGRRT